MNDNIINSATAQALATIALEAQALDEISALMKQEQNPLKLAIGEIVTTIKNGGHLVVTGMGKSGHIAQKISATFASTGTPSFYLHPAEAVHGDFGRVSRKDLILALSYSGKSSEILALLPSIKRWGNKLIVISGSASSPLAQAADIFLNGVVAKEACPHNLAPTCSTTVQLALGDALAIGVLVAQGFSTEDFLQFHPGGALGKKLITVGEIMRFDKAVPIVDENATLACALSEITRGGLGMTAILNSRKAIIGLFTDGDLRRVIEKSIKNNCPQNFDININITEIMTKTPKRININALAAQALAIMEKYKINQLIVVDDDDKLIGALNMHDLLTHNIV